MRYWFYIVIVMCSSCVGKVPDKNKTPDGPGIKVSTIMMSKSTDMRTRSYVGQAKASRSVTLLAPYPGTLRLLEATVGEPVFEGDILAEIHSESIRSAYDMAQATLEQAEDGYARATKVHAKGGITEVKYKEVETDLAKARAAAAAAEDALKSCRIIAPFDAVVSAVYAHQGSELTMNQPLVKLLDPASLEIEFSVPEGELSGISEGMAAEVDIPALDKEGLQATIITKGVEASPVSHTYECTLKLLQPIDGFAPGMICKVVLGKDMQPNYIIPAYVVQTDRNGRYVWTVRNGTVFKTYVAIGGFAGNGVIVTDGLSDGDIVIYEGFRKVSSGMKVDVLSERIMTAEP